MQLKSAFLGIYELLGLSYGAELKKAAAGCESLLDVGCGSSSPIRAFSKGLHCVGVDLFRPSIEESRRQGIHSEYHQMAVLDIDKKFGPKSFDCIAALDLIEHLEKKDGLALLEKMELIARNKVIVFTPNGFLPQGVHYNNPWQVHLSGWTVDEMEKRGYRVIGVHGWKPLRGERGGIKFWPNALWAGISLASNVLVRNNPRHAFQLLCVKTLQ